MGLSHFRPRFFLLTERTVVEITHHGIPVMLLDHVNDFRVETVFES